jgi:colanic acid/amylovoran biosynthesis glycosyltransferase
MSRLLVYRDHILPASERAFMRRQYLGFERLEPYWLGRRLDKDVDPVFHTLAPLDGLAGALFKTFGRVPRVRELAGMGFVAVHAQFGRGGALALPLARRLGLPLLVTFHGGDVHKSAHYRGGLRPALLRRRQAELSEYASRFVCVSASVRARLIGRGFPAEKAVVLPIGVEALDERPSSEPRAGVLFAGRLVEMKGVAVLAEAVKILRARGVEEPVVIIGEGPDGRSLRSALGQVSGVSFLGWRSPDEVRAAMRRSRLVCVPSVVARSGEAEGLPSVAVEAMSVATPVIGSSDAGLAGVLEPGVSGLVFPSRDANALADGIERLIRDPALAAAMGRAALARAARDFDAHRQSRQLEAQIEAVVAEHATPAL